MRVLTAFVLCCAWIGLAADEGLRIQSIVIREGDSASTEVVSSSGIISDVEIRKIEAEYLGQEITVENLGRLKESILGLLEEQGEFAAEVEFPDQDISKGIVVLAVKTPHIEKIEVQGNRWEGAEYYRNKVDLYVGEPLNTDELLTEVAWLNRNPFNHMEVVLGPGSKRNAIDVDLLVQDRFAFRPFAGADNTGTNVIDQVRLFAGFNWGKAFGRSDLLTYQFTSAPSSFEFFSHTISYLCFLPWKHEMTLYGGYSRANPNVSDFSQQGRDVQASFRYAIPFKPIYETTTQTGSWGFDYKNINSNVFFIDTPETPLITHQVNIFQLFAGYEYKKKLGVRAEVFISPYRWLPNQSNYRYDQLRPHSTAQYIYARLALSDSYEIPRKFMCAWTVRGQAASGPLLPSEQFGLGGYDTVRGYQERDYIADNALCINGEVRAPKVSVYKRDELIFLAFSDLGWGSNYQSEQSDQSSQFLWSLGLGARYRLGSYFNLRADYGFQLHHIYGQNAFGRFHLGGYVSY